MNAPTGRPHEHGGSSDLHPSSAYPQDPYQQPGYYGAAQQPAYTYGAQAPQAYPQQPAVMGMPAAVPVGYGSSGHKPPAANMRGGGGGGGDDWDLEAAQAAVAESAYMEKAQAAMRVAFMRKVYSILLIQLLATVGLAALFMFEPSVNAFVLSSPRLLIAGLVLSLVALVALICFRHKHPANIILLGLWTVIEAYTLGVVCASLQTSGAGEIVWQAFVITSAIFVGLTLFTLVSKADFSWLGAVVFAGLIGLIAWGLITWIMGWRQSFIYSLFGAILFSLLIVYDTWLISKRLSPDEYILGSISLYLLGGGRRG